MERSCRACGFSDLLAAEAAIAMLAGQMVMEFAKTASG